MAKRSFKKSSKSHSHLLLFAVSIIGTFFLFQTPAFAALTTATQGFSWVASFIAGIFFTSFMTIAPASAVIAALSLDNPPLHVAIWGALGATLGDLILFTFIKEALPRKAPDIFKKKRIARFRHFFSSPLLHYITPVIGGLIIASPLPDEIGLAMLGVSHVRPHIVALISFPFNFLGILAIISLVQSI